MKIDFAVYKLSGVKVGMKIRMFINVGYKMKGHG